MRRANMKTYGKGERSGIAYDGEENTGRVLEAAPTVNDES